MNIDHLRTLLGERFDDFFEIIKRLIQICSLLSNYTPLMCDRTLLDSGNLLLYFPDNFRCEDLWSLTMMINTVDPLLVRHIFDMINQVVNDPNMKHYVGFILKHLRDSEPPPIPGKNPIIFRQDMWAFLVKINNHWRSCQPVPRSLSSVYMIHRARFPVLPLEISFNLASISRARRMMLLCLSGNSLILMKKMVVNLEKHKRFHLISAITKVCGKKQAIRFLK